MACPGVLSFSHSLYMAWYMGEGDVRKTLWSTWESKSQILRALYTLLAIALILSPRNLQVAWSTMAVLLIVSHSYGNINLAECAVSDMHLVCFSHLQKNMFQLFSLLKCRLCLLLIVVCVLLDLFPFFFLLKIKRVIFVLTDHFSQNHVLESPNSPVLQGKVERGSTGVIKNQFLLTQN